MRKEKLLKVLLAPRITEKAANASGESGCPQYVFKVATCANKHDVKAAVEALFQVSVKAVNILRQKGSSVSRFGKSSGRQSDWKKAYVTLNAGQEINIV